jgi:hypothetical protein
MKRSWVCLILLIVSFYCFAGDFNELPFLPVSPFIMGQGGAFTADSNGYYGLFTNPAGFVSKEGSGLILPAAGFWTYANIPDAMDTNWSDAASRTNYYDKLMKEGGYGNGASLGAAFLGGGFGLGMTLVADSWFHGDRLASAMDGYLQATFGITAGYAFTLDFSGIKLNLGADIRPLYRINARLSSADAVRIMDEFMASVADPARNFDFFSSIRSVPAVHGIGVGFDVGAILDMGEFNIGLAIRDIGRTNFLYTRNTVGEILDALGAFKPAPQGDSVAGDYFFTPMNVSLGVSWNPDFGCKPVLDPVFALDFQDIVSVFSTGKPVLAMLHAGATLNFFERLFYLQAGLNQGYFTFGLGAKVLFAECGIAFFTREAGNSGFAVDLRLRF